MVSELENRFYDVDGIVKQSFWGKISIIFGILIILWTVILFTFGDKII